MPGARQLGTLAGMTPPEPALPRALRCLKRGQAHLPGAGHGQPAGSVARRELQRPARQQRLAGPEHIAAHRLAGAGESVQLLTGSAQKWSSPRGQ